MSRECPRSVTKVSRTLWGNSRDTFWTLRSPRPEGPWGHPPGHSVGHPDFRGHSVRHSPGHSGPKGPRESPVGGRRCLKVKGYFIRSEKLQNESFPNFLIFRPEFCPEFCSEFSPNFLRSFRASFRGRRRPEKIHQKSPPFFNVKFPGKHKKKYSQNVSGERSK